MEARWWESSFLSACEALVEAQQELVPRLAETLGVPREELFYAWMDRHFPAVVVPPDEDWKLQVGQIAGTDWHYFFHGFECDISHGQDGPYIRVEFGPRGRFDLLSAYAVLQFVMTSHAPWSEFPALREYLAEKPPPYDRRSGSFQKAVELWDHLEARGFLEPAAPDLCSLRRTSMKVQADGKRVLALPEGLSEREYLDCLVSCGAVLSTAALRQLGDESQVPPEVWKQIDDHLSRSHTIYAINLLRETTGCGVARAKEAIFKRFEARFPELAAVHRSLDEDD